MVFWVVAMVAMIEMTYADELPVNGGTISGHVVDKETGEPLVGVNVIIKGSQRGMQTNKSGAFDFVNMAPGSYTIRVQYMGYKSEEQTVKLDKGRSSHLHFELQPDLFLGEEIVITASRNEVSRKEAPVVVNVVAEQLFETVNSCDLAQSLSFQSGLRVENNCQNCGFPQVRINGLDGPYSQILINSRPIMSALSGVYGLEQIPVNMIDRVEIVRGGGSALFGANAVAGTINIITKEPVDNSYSAGATYSLIDKNASSFNFNANAALVGKEERSGFSFYQSYRDRDHWDKDGDGFSEIGELTAHSFGFNSYLKPNEVSRISLDYHTTKEHRRGGNKFELQPHQSDITEQTEHLINGGGLTYDLFLNDFMHKWSVYTAMQHIDRNSYYGSHQDTSAYGHTNDFTWMAGSQFVSDYDRFLFAPATITYGIEYQYNGLRDKMLGYNRVIDQKVQTGGGYVQSEWHMEKMNLLAGLRLDKHNKVERLIVSPRINFLYKFSADVQGRLTYSSGFRAPQAFDEDLHVTQVGGEGMIVKLADGLKEERSNSVSASVDLYHSFGENVRGNLLVEGFYTDLKNVFVLESMGYDEASGAMIKERRNGAGARVGGLNLDGRLAFGHNDEFQLQLGYTLSRNRYKKTEQWSDDPTAVPVKKMMRTPNQYGYFTFTYNPFNTFKAMLSGVYTGTMNVPHLAGYIEHDRMEKTPHFMDLNIKLSHDFSVYKDFVIQLNAGVQNVFNAFQKDLDKGVNRDSGYFYGPSQPRTYFIGIKLMN